MEFDQKRSMKSWILSILDAAEGRWFVSIPSSQLGHVVRGSLCHSLACISRGNLNLVVHRYLVQRQH